MLENPVKYIKVAVILFISIGVGTAFTSIIAGDKWAIYQSTLISAWLIGNVAWLFISRHISQINNRVLGMVAVANALLLAYLVAGTRIAPPDFSIGDHIGTPWGMAQQWALIIGAWHVALGALVPEFLVVMYHSVEEAVAELKKKKEATAVTTEQATAEQ